MARPLITKTDIWKEIVIQSVEVFNDALLELRNKGHLPDSETLLNRELDFCLLESIRKKAEEGKVIDIAPMIDARNQPDPDDPPGAIREKKFPDFSIPYIDHAEPDARKSRRVFVIECKRLGKPVRSDWVFNENYVHHGIRRFITMEHGYAKNERFGAMVGYIQSMDFDDILAEVNAAADNATIPKLQKPGNGWNEKGTSHMDQTLNRPFPISPFQLSHLWIDLRDCNENYTTS